MTEKRGRLKEITQETVESQIQGWQPSLPHLARVNEAARKHRGLKFTNLLHHIDLAALERAFRRQRSSASAGIDGVGSVALVMRCVLVCLTSQTTVG